MSHMLRSVAWCGRVAVVLSLWTATAIADQPEVFTSRVIGVADGDTLTVLRGQEPVKVRLQGIDCPEGGQAFGNVAKRHLSDLVFGKEVTVMPRDTDRYGRMVADVAIEGRDVGLAMVEAGLAWHFTRYSSDQRLAAAEREARAAKRGLWRDPSPIAPWEFRHPAPLAAIAGPVVFHGNRQSLVVHGPRCQYYNCKNCVAEFATLEAAAAAGYRPHADCTR
jgi:endonuclease YncB( thermonuclease family)